MAQPQQGRIGLAMAGWIHAGGVGTLTRTTGHMNADEYVHILHDHTLPSIRQTFGIIPQDVELVNILQDNIPIHTSVLVRQYLRSQRDVKFLPMPALSPDLNPIENIWARIFAKCPEQLPRSEEALWGFCQAKWELLGQNQQLFRNLADSMKRRMEAVLAADGGHTKY